MCQELAAFETVLTTARKLQISRLKTAFQLGFEIPEDVRERYSGRYKAECRKCPDETKGANIYKKLFDEFLADIRELADACQVLNRLDLMTLFGEICTGEYIANKAGIYKSSKTVH